MSLPNDFIAIYVMPSSSSALRPITAFIGGTQLKGYGHTIEQAIEDLFSSSGAGKICRKLEREVEKALAHGGFPDRRAEKAGEESA